MKILKSLLGSLGLLAMILSTKIIAGEDLLTRLGAQTQEIQNLQGRFEQQKNIAVLPVPLMSSGRFALEQGKSIDWQLLEPVQQTIRLSPNGITLESGGKAGKLGEAMPAQGAETLTKVFMAVVSGQWETLSEYFEIEASGDADKWQLLLLPRSQALAAYIRQIEIRGGEFTEQLDIAEANGDSTIIRLTIDKVVRRQP